MSLSRYTGIFCTEVHFKVIILFLLQTIRAIKKDEEATWLYTRKLICFQITFFLRHEKVLKAHVAMVVSYVFDIKKTYCWWRHSKATENSHDEILRQQIFYNSFLNTELGIVPRMFQTVIDRNLFSMLTYQSEAKENAKFF